MSTGDLLQAQLLLAAVHRILGETREVREDLAVESYDEALAKIADLRTSLASASHLLEELDAAIGVLAYRECLTCDQERTSGRLQCPACCAATDALTPAVEGALRTTPTWPPRSS
jgi:hypothetical protein